MDLATLKFKVETGELKSAITLLESLTTKARELTKTTSELLKADREAAEVSLAQAKAQIQVLNVQIKQVELEGKLAVAKNKKAKLDNQELKNATEIARAKEREAAANLKTVQAEAKVARAKEDTTRVKKEEVSVTDALTSKIQKLVDQTSFVVQGNSKGESSFLALIKSMGATEDQMKKVTDLFEVQRKVIGGDPFDKSASAAAKLSRELKILEQYMKGTGSVSDITRQQSRELAREVERLTQLSKEQGLTQEQTADIIRRESEAYIANAKALNNLERELRQKTKAANDAIKADERRADSLRKVKDIEDKMQGKFILTKQSAIENQLLPKSVITNLINYEKALNSAGIAGAEFEKKMTNMRRVLVQTEGVRAMSEGLSSFTKNLIASAIAMVGLNAAFDVFQRFFETTDMLKNMAARMNAVSEGTVNMAQAFPELLRVSNLTGASLESVGTIFNRLLPAMEGYGRGGKDAMKITENLSKILLVSGASASEASAALLQVSQAFAKGKLDGDEFRSVAENMPEVLRLLEQHLNKNRGQLYLMAEQGQITGNILSEVLSKNIEKLNEQAAKMPLTVGRATNELRNSFTSLVKTFDEATGASEKVAKGIQAVADGMASLAGADMSSVTTFFGTLMGAGVTAGAYAIASNIVSVAGSVTTLGVAIKSLGVFLAANPVLLALLGIGAVAGYVMSKDVKTSPAKPADTIEGITKQIQEAEREIRAIEAARTDRSLRHSKEAQEGYKKQLQEQVTALQEYIRVRDKLLDDSQKTEKSKMIAALPKDQQSAYQKMGDLNRVYGQSSAAKKEQLQQQLLDTKNGFAAERNLAEAEFKKNTAKLKEGSAEYSAFLAAKELRIKEANKRELYITEQTQKDIEELLKKGVKKKQEISLQFSALDSSSDIRKVYDKERENEEKRTKFQIAELEFRHKYGLISEEEYYRNYEAVSLQGMRNAIGNEEKFTADTIKVKEELIRQAGVALANYKSQNVGVEGYTQKVAEATKNYDARVADLRSEISSLTNVSKAFREGKLDEYFKRLTERTDQFASKVFNLKKDMEDSIGDENRRVAAQAEEYEMQQKIIGMSEAQAAGVKAEYEERKRLNQLFGQKLTYYDELIEEQKSLQKIIDETSPLEVVDNENYKAQIQRLEEIGKAVEKMKGSADYIRNLMTVGPEQAKLEAIKAAQEKSYAEFIDKLGDGVYIGLTKGAKQGAKSIRDTIVEELNKPIQILVKAVVSDVVGGKGLFGQGSKSGNALDSLMSTAGKVMDFFSSGSSGEGFSLSGMMDGANSMLGGNKMLYSLGSNIAKIGMKMGSDALINFADGISSSSSMTGISKAFSEGGAQLAGSLAGMALTAFNGFNLSKALSGGYKIKGLNINAIAGVASIFLGPVAAVIGAVINRAFGMGAKKVTTKGITGTFSSSGFSGQGFSDWTQKGGWFRSNKSGTDYSALDSSVTDSFTQQYAKILTTVGLTATSIGVATDNLETFSKTIRLVLGDDATKNQEAITAMFNELSDSMVTHLIPAISMYAKENETSTATLTRLSSSLMNVNQVFASMGKNLVALSMESANAASSLIDLFGSLEKLKEATSTYVDAFYTDSQKFALTLKQVNEVFSSLGISVPSTKEAFKDIVDQLDITTEFGNKAYYALISIAPAFASLFDSAETTKTKFVEVAKSIRDTITSIKVSQLTPVNEFAAMKQTFDSLVAKASVATGDELVSLSNQINSAIEPLISKAKDVYASGSEFVAIQEEIFAKAGMIADIGDSAGTVQDQSLVELQTISDILAKINSTGLLTVGKLEDLLALNTNWSGTPVAVGTSSDSTKSNAILAAIGEANKLTVGYSAKINSESLTQSIAGVMQQIQSLTDEGNNLSMQGKYAERYRKTVEIPQAIAELQTQLANLQGQQAYYSNLMYGNFSTTSLETQLQSLRDIIRANGGIPQFAKGGMFTNGVVSEPTLFNMGVMGEATPEAIMPLTRTNDGSLGVRVQGSTDMSQVVEKLSENNRHAEANVRVSQAVGKEVLNKLQAIERRLEGLENESRLERYKA